MKKITPFSNGTDFILWQKNNCHCCSKYENKSTLRKNAGCKYAFDLDLECVGSGKISLNTAEWIGYKNEALNRECNIKNIIFSPLKMDLEYRFQKRLF